MAKSTMMKLIVHAIFILFFVSCKQRNIKYSGFNDLVVGSQSFILYDDNTFYIEMGGGGIEGNYKISKDIVTLNYYDKPSEEWPDTMLIRKDYFISKDSLDNARYLKIRRDR